MALVLAYYSINIVWVRRMRTTERYVSIVSRWETQPWPTVLSLVSRCQRREGMAAQVRTGFLTLTSAGCAYRCLSTTGLSVETIQVDMSGSSRSFFIRVPQPTALVRNLKPLAVKRFLDGIFSQLVYPWETREAMCATQCLITLHVWCEANRAWAFSDIITLHPIKCADKAWMMVNSRWKQVSGFKTHTVKSSLVYDLDDRCAFRLVFLWNLAHVWVRKDRQGQVSVCLEFREWRSTYPPFIGLSQRTCLVWGTVYMCVCGAAYQSIVTVMAIWNIWRGMMWPKGGSCEISTGCSAMPFRAQVALSHDPRGHVAMWHEGTLWRVDTSHFQSHVSPVWPEWWPVCTVQATAATTMRVKLSDRALPHPGLAWSMYSRLKGSLTF